MGPQDEAFEIGELLCCDTAAVLQATFLLIRLGVRRVASEAEGIKKFPRFKKNCTKEKVSDVRGRYC